MISMGTLIVIPLEMAKIEATIEMEAEEGLHVMKEETIGIEQVLMTALGEDDLLPLTGTRIILHF